MQQALERFGAGNFVYSGEIWVIPDPWITFADFDSSARTTHETRYVLALQGDDLGRNQDCPTILVMPLSSQTQNKRLWEDVLDEVESPLTSPSIVKVHLLQPVPRRALVEDGERIGAVTEDALRRIQAHLLMNLGLLGGGPPASSSTSDR